MKELQSHIIAGAGTLVLLLLLLLLLCKLSMHAPIELEDEGIVITFGDADEGGGMPDAIPFDQITQTEQLPAPATPTHASDNDLMVQEDEESLVLPEQNEDEQKRMEEEAEQLRQQREAEALAQAERIAKEKALAEQKARQEEAIKKAQAAVAMFGQAASTEGANAANATATPSATSKGNPVGKNFGIENGNMWSLQGRSVKAMPKPSQDFKEQGKVVVNITVDKVGNVTNATIGDGTTISDRYTQQLALDAARKAKFSDGETPQRGTIIYNFKLN